MNYFWCHVEMNFSGNFVVLRGQERMKYTFIEIVNVSGKFYFEGEKSECRIKWRRKWSGLNYETCYTFVLIGVLYFDIFSERK